jgi:putative exosortase-associated protein (TIGR04073 family)
MRKILVVTVLGLFLLAFAAQAEEYHYLKASGKKAQRGVTNLLTGWLEVPFQTVKGFKSGFGEKEKNKVLGGTFGVFRGIIHACGRTATGIYELATFPLPNPKNNQGVGLPLDAENAWEEGTQYSIVNQGLEPVGKKAFRGLLNAGFGIIDVPGQIHKGFVEDKPWRGLGKAVLFPLGRVSSGIFDVAACLLPGEAQYYGYPLEEKLPWDALERDRYHNEY